MFIREVHSNRYDSIFCVCMAVTHNRYFLFPRMWPIILNTIIHVVIYVFARYLFVFPWMRESLVCLNEFYQLLLVRDKLYVLFSQVWSITSNVPHCLCGYTMLQWMWLVISSTYMTRYLCVCMDMNPYSYALIDKIRYILVYIVVTRFIITPWMMAIIYSRFWWCNIKLPKQTNN